MHLLTVTTKGRRAEGSLWGLFVKAPITSRRPQLLIPSPGAGGGGGGVRCLGFQHVDFGRKYSSWAHSNQETSFPSLQKVLSISSFPHIRKHWWKFHSLVLFGLFQNFIQRKCYMKFLCSGFFLSSSYLWDTSISSVQLLSCVRLFATPWTAARQASLSITNSRSPPKFISIESVMPSNHLILCHPLLLLPSIFPSIRVFSNESTLRMR